MEPLKQRQIIQLLRGELGLRNRQPARQRPMLAVYGVCFVIIIAVTGGTSIYWLHSASTARLAVIANFLSLGTLLLAVLAGIVALAAYAAATGLPDLQVQFAMGSNACNIALFRYVEPDGTLQSYGNNVARISVSNVSKYAARTPAVLIRFGEDLGIRPEQYSHSNGWIPVDTNVVNGDIKALQWDGGPAYAVHGRSYRTLPPLCLKGLRMGEGIYQNFISNKITDDDCPRIYIGLLADGYWRDEIRIPSEIGEDRIQARGLTPDWV
jgi:hypothetical protein